LIITLTAQLGCGDVKKKVRLFRGKENDTGKTFTNTAGFLEVLLRDDN